MERLQKVFKNEYSVFIAFITAGYPSLDSTVNLVLAMEKNGVDVVELGFPFSDPIADGPIIQTANEIALNNGLTVDKYFEIVAEIRKHSKLPLLMMTYYNVVLQYGIDKMCKEMNRLDMSGFILVDLPNNDTEFVHACNEHNLTFVPFISPLTPEIRMKKLLKAATSFTYVVSRLGVTGKGQNLEDSEFKLYLDNIRKHSSKPLAVGFGIKTGEQFKSVAQFSEGIVIGSEIINIIKDSTDPIKAVGAYCKEISSYKVKSNLSFKQEQLVSNESLDVVEGGLFGQFGGSYIPEVLDFCLKELNAEFEKAKSDPEFWIEFKNMYSYMGRPTPLYLATRLTEHANGAQIWLKREDLTHTGSHKINNAVGQCLLAKRLGKKRIIAETGAGQHGVATATVCAKMGLECIIFMGAEDIKRQELNVFRMKVLGAKVVPVSSGSKTLKDAINEAMRDWVSNVNSTHYLVGSAIGPHPFPSIVKEFQSVIGKETMDQFNKQVNKLPDCVIACVGGGSNAIGIFAPFIEHKQVKLIGVEAAGQGLTTNKHSAPLTCGTVGVLHGTKTYLMQNKDGQIIETHSISAGLDYPGGTLYSFSWTGAFIFEGY